MSLRAWIATRFSMLLLGAMVVFVIAMFLTRQSRAYEDAAALSQERARAASLIIRRTADAGEPITARGMRELLDVLPGYLWVLDSFEVIYTSQLAAALDTATVLRINAGLKNLRERLAPSLQVSIRGSAALVEKQDLLPNGRVLRVVSAVPLADVSLSPLEVLSTALIVMPLVLGLAIWGAFLIAARATEPLERLTTEVVEITDGRSLHRRLNPPPDGTLEVTRLTVQLNEMIGRLEMSFAALRRFTADASHELKTPLAVLRADVERAMHVQPGGTEQLVALEEALHETTRMADLVESLLTLARADEGRFDLVREPVALEPLAHDVFETALILGEDAGLKVTMPKVENSVVNGDRTRLRQLFLNLITNAIKYTPRGGDVELQLTASEEEATFSVRDTGIGIAAIDLPNIFDRFYRADRVRARASERGGFGLGLSISQWIAQAHGGSLSVQSRLHRGSTFTVSLPVYGHAPVDTVPPPADRRQAQGIAAD